MHPLLRLIMSQPGLLVDHAEAYAELVSAEFSKASVNWKRSLLLDAIAICSLGVAAVLAGVAVMLWATIPASDIRAPWALMVTPLLPAVVALVCMVAARSRNDAHAFDDLKEQVAADMVMLRVADAP